MSIQELQVAGTTTPEKATSSPAETKRRGHQYEADVVRTVTFGGVILDHCVAGTTADESVAANGVQTVLHYTRNAFFALTGFVLVFQYRDRELKATTFWRRRFKLIGLPYVTWTVIYFGLSIYAPPWIPTGFFHFGEAFGSIDAALSSLKALAIDLLSGDGWYHLYFVFVSMQIYILFPLLLKVLRWTWGYHRYLLAASFAFHLVLMHYMAGLRPQIANGGALGFLWDHLPRTVFPYQFYILGGAIAAMHLEGFRAWMVKRRNWVFAVAGAVSLVAIGYYLNLVEAGMYPEKAANVFRPFATFLFVSVILSLYALGTLWSERRTPGSFLDKFLAKASDRSFGIFLVHAFSLQMVAPIITMYRDIVYPPIVSTVTFLVVVVMTVAIVEVLRRSPLSMITTGRERKVAKAK